jgi:metal iron transporter
MNCPVRTDPFPGEGHNQNPPELAPELTTRKSLNTPRGSIGSTPIDLIDGSHNPAEEAVTDQAEDEHGASQVRYRKGGLTNPGPDKKPNEKKIASASIGFNMLHRTISGRDRAETPNDDPGNGLVKGWFLKVRNVLVKYTKFIGPGFLVSVAYIDPGQYELVS